MSIWGDQISFQGTAGAATPVQVAYASAGTGAEATGAGVINVPYPATVTSGQFLLLHVVARDTAAASVTTPSGWTSIDERQIGGVTHESQVFWKIASGSEGGTNLTVSVADDVKSVGRIYSFDNGSGVESATGQTNTASSTSMPASNITSTVNLCLGVQCFYAQVNTTIGNITGESGGDYNEAVAEYSSSAALMSLQIATLATATSVTGGTATLGAAGTNRITHAFVIKP